MRSRKKVNSSVSIAILTFTTLIGAVLLPFGIVKSSIKNWLFVFLVSVIGNSQVDRYLVTKGYLNYRIRPFLKKVKIHLPFDYIHYLFNFFITINGH
ncbi:MAG: hypothetical protein ACQEUT_18890 [Bacillota bacterium]